MRRREMVELRFRLPADGWKDLTAVLAAALGAAPGAEVQRRGEENGSFDERVFRRLEEMEETALPERRAAEEEGRSYRGEGAVDLPLTAPVPAEYRAMEAQEKAEKEPAEEHWERRVERDCRRYDSGFPLR